MTALVCAQIMPAYSVVFAAGTALLHSHQDNMPPLSRNWKKIQQNPHCTDFTTAVYKKYEDLAQRDTFDVI